jgi:hypothetical protein
VSDIQIVVRLPRIDTRLHRSAVRLGATVELVGYTDGM